VNDEVNLLVIDELIPEEDCGCWLVAPEYVAYFHAGGVRGIIIRQTIGTGIG
jgi:hypothetical protein